MPFALARIVLLKPLTGINECPVACAFLVNVRVCEVVIEAANTASFPDKLVNGISGVRVYPNPWVIKDVDVILPDASVVSLIIAGEVGAPSLITIISSFEYPVPADDIVILFTMLAVLTLYAELLTKLTWYIALLTKLIVTLAVV